MPDAIQNPLQTIENTLPNSGLSFSQTTLFHIKSSHAPLYNDPTLREMV